MKITFNIIESATTITSGTITSDITKYWNNPEYAIIIDLIKLYDGNMNSLYRNCESIGLLDKLTDMLMEGSEGIISDINIIKSENTEFIQLDNLCNYELRESKNK